MITFTNTTKRAIGRADVIQLATIEEDRVANNAGRPGFEPYFLIKIVFDSGGEHCLAEVPTGHFQTPYAVTTDEIILTDGEDFWVGARNLTPEQLEANQTPIDPTLYILDEDELPDRLKLLTIADRDHIIKKIKLFCEEQFKRSDKQKDSSWIV